jgi:polysaccharide biosynthesis transport protein
MHNLAMKNSDAHSNLNSYVTALKYRWPSALGVLIGVFCLGSLITFLRKPIYIAEAAVKFERLSLKSSLSTVGKEVGQLEPLLDRNNPLKTETEIIRSVPVVQQTIDQLKLKDQKGIPLKYKAFLQQLTIGEIRSSDILKITYRHQNPEIAAQVVNTLIDIYFKQNWNSRRSQVVAARKFIEAELPEAEMNVRQAEEAMRQFKQANNVVALKEESVAIVTILNSLQQQISAVRGQIADLDAQAVVLQNKLGIDPQRAIEMTVLSQTSGVQETLKQLQQVENQLAREHSLFQDAHPNIASLEDERTNLQALLQSRIAQISISQNPASDDNLQMGTLQQDLTKEMVALSSKRQGLINQLETLLKTQSDYQTRSSLLPNLEKEQRELERKLEASQSTYTQLLKKGGEVRVAVNQSLGNAQVISEAQAPDQPISKTTSYLAALAVGLMAAGATVYLLESRDKSVKTIEQTQKLLRYPLLGVIPSYNPSQGIDCDKPKTESNIQATLVSAVGATYRMLQANLRFVSAHQPLKVIVVTSSVSKEGKSTVSAHLSATIAQTGRRVLLIDGDMHHPQQHDIWQLSNTAGLTQILMEQIVPEQAIQQVLPHLDVLTSGDLPLNTLAVLDSQEMFHLVKQLRVEYDCIIIDAPPMSIGADAQVLGKIADGLVFLIRPGVVDEGNIRFARERLEQSEQNVLGIVVNGCSTKNDPHSHYYFIEQYYDNNGHGSASWGDYRAH